jgi:hypothetical protein
VTVAVPLDAETVGMVVVVFVVAGVVDAEVAALVPEVVLVVDRADEVDAADAALEAAVFAAVLALLTVAPPAWAASPANRPVPASALASDHRVMRLIRRSPASRSCLVRLGFGLLMVLIFGPRLVRPLAVG